MEGICLLVEEERRDWPMNAEILLADYLDGDVTRVEAWERLHEDRPEVPIPSEVAQFLLRMREKEAAWLAERKIYRDPSHYMAERETDSVPFLELKWVVFESDIPLIKRRREWRKSRGLPLLGETSRPKLTLITNGLAVGGIGGKNG